MKKMKGRKFGRKGDTAAMLDHFDKTIVINFFFFFFCILFFIIHDLSLAIQSQRHLSHQFQP